jgi:hypothetical protein
MTAPLPTFVARPGLAARRRRRRVAAVVAAVAAVAIVVTSHLAARAPDAFGGAAVAPGRAAWSRKAPPPTLAATGLYADVAAKTLAPGVRTYAPQYPLWTDGARKARFLALPPGSTIDASDPDLWVFPMGTRLWKEFSLEHRVETRYLERADDGWIAATYLWDAAEREAVLAPARVPRRRGAGPAYPTTSPAAWTARRATTRATPVLGVSALQLSPDRDPLAPHAEAPRLATSTSTPGARAAVVGQGDACARRAHRRRRRGPRGAQVPARQLRRMPHDDGPARVARPRARRAGPTARASRRRSRPSSAREQGARAHRDRRRRRARGARAPDASVLWRRVTSRSPLLRCRRSAPAS